MRPERKRPTQTISSRIGSSADAHGVGRGRGDGYDALAPVYAALERITFGNLLMRARLAQLPAVDSAKVVLVIGEGDGRLVLELLRRRPQGQLLVIEPSAGMRRVAQRRLERALGRVAMRDLPVRYLAADVRTLSLPPAAFDAIVTPFVLDLFDAAELAALVPRLAAALRPGGVWLHSDFAVPARGWRRTRAQLWLAVLYRVFSWLTSMRARALVPAPPLLQAAGLEPRAVRSFSAGLLESWCFVKPDPRQARSQAQQRIPNNASAAPPVDHRNPK